MGGARRGHHVPIPKVFRVEKVHKVHGRARGPSAEHLRAGHVKDVGSRGLGGLRVHDQRWIPREVALLSPDQIAGRIRLRLGLILHLALRRFRLFLNIKKQFFQGKKRREEGKRR
jgi:hypothetical protein